MPSSAAVTVAATATPLNASLRLRVDFIVAVPSGGVTVYVGGSDVTTANGIPVEAGNSLAIDNLDVGEIVYGIVAASTQAVTVLTAVA